MRTLFICDEFTYDLTGKELHWTEENPWFTDEFILTSTFPFSIDFDEEPFFLIFEFFNADLPKTMYLGMYQSPNGKLTPAKFEIDGAEEKLTGVIRVGIELFPSWDKKLSELPMGTVNPPEGMLAHAETVITKTFPEVNYNFPLIWCREQYADNPLFEAFLGYYNYFIPGHGFVENIESPSQNLFSNHNIVYPFPYWIHILKSGVESAGYTLHGDILTDPDFIKALMPIKKVVFQERPETIEWIIGEADVVENYVVFKNYHSELTLSPNVRYRIRGTSVNEITQIRIRYSGNVLFQQEGLPPGEGFDFYIEQGLGGLLELDATAFFPGIDDIIEGFVIPTIIYDEDGNVVPAIANFNNVDLAMNLPEISFGDLVKICKSWKNYDFDLRDGKEIWMNLIDREMTHDNAVDMRQWEVEFPKRKYDQEGSYLVKFSEENEEFPLVQTFVNKDGIQTTGFRTDNNTKEIIINAVPLPCTAPPLLPGQTEPFPQSIITARMIIDDPSKPALVLYDGLRDGRNKTIPPDNLMTPVVTGNFWFKYIMFMIRSVLYTWSVEGYVSDFLSIHRKSKLFAYNNYMIVKSLNRKQKRDMEEIEIEARSY